MIDNGLKVRDILNVAFHVGTGYVVSEIHQRNADSPIKTKERENQERRDRLTRDERRYEDVTNFVKRLGR